jgi:APA family basic amino acid/polyamine antiporter
MVLNERQKLKKVLSRSDVLALSFGTMIGWGWIMLPGHWIADAGFAGALISFLIGGTMCIFVGLTYAELTTALPIAGGELAFAYRGLGHFWAWVAGWAISFAYVGVASWEGIAISTAIDYLFVIPKMGYLWTIAGYDVYFSWAAIGMTGAVILTVLNVFGVKPAAVFQIMGTLGLVASGLIFVSGGAAFGESAYIGPLFTSAAGMGAVLLMTPSMFVGFDVIPQSTEEMNMPLRDIAKVLILSIILACSWYMIMIVSIAVSLPAELRGLASVPVADAASFAYKTPIFGKIMIVGGMCGIMTSWNGFFVGASRIIFAMSRARMLPKIFATLHPTYQTPVAALGMVGVICCLSPLMGKNALIWFINSAALGTVISYLLVAISFIIIRKKEPDLARPFKVRKWKLVGSGAIASSLFFLCLYTPLSSNTLTWPYEWGLVLIWSAAGILLALRSRVSYRGTTMKDRELLMFGEEYARDEIAK